MDADIDSRIGTRVRQLRLQRSLTLDGLAARADVSRAMLSRIEHGQSSPTAQLLNKICGGLGVTMSVLFAEPAAAANPLARRDKQPVWRDPATGYLRRTVSPAGVGSAVDIAEIVFPPGESVVFRNEAAPGVDQQVWVLEGTLEIGVGAEMFCLEQGDCLHMSFGQPILFRNATEQPIRYAVVVSHGPNTP